MTQRSWTLLVVPHGSDSPRTFTLTERALRIASGMAAMVGIIAAIGIGVLVSTIGMPTSRIAQRENRLLSQELVDLRLRLRHLEDTLNVIGKHDERVRLLAGLPAVDSQVAQVGIGGPGLPKVTDDPLYRANPTLGRMAFDTRIDLDKLLRRANLLAKSFADVSDSLTKHHERYQRIPSIMPTAGWLSSHFSRNRFHPILHTTRPHEGIDVSAPMGAPIIAPAAGVVVRVGREAGYGLVLEIDHGNGIETKFAHMSRVMVRRGQRVKRGQEIAAVGNSGLSTGPHLHYEIHINGKVVDPLTYVMPDAIPD
jgi:murein DD-endopeptidase MepM/ murein hydrolase activator NlpD